MSVTGSDFEIAAEAELAARQMAAARAPERRRHIVIPDNGLSGFYLLISFSDVDGDYENVLIDYYRDFPSAQAARIRAELGDGGQAHGLIADISLTDLPASAQDAIVASMDIAIHNQVVANRKLMGLAGFGV